MLGILALIAVGIILLCMWGEEGADQTPQPGQRQAQTEQEMPELDPDLAQLYDELLGEDNVGSPPSSHDMSFSMEIGGAAPRASEPVDEEAVLRGVIESMAPQQIPLTPTRPAFGETEPAPADSPPEPPASEMPLTHVVQKGETLSGISRKYYGTTARWRTILEANRDKLNDPRELRPNMKLRIPTSADTLVSAGGSSRSGTAVLNASSAGRDARTHTVQKGDTLFRIALKYYGDGARYKEVLAANRGKINGPLDLRPGMELVVP